MEDNRKISEFNESGYAISRLNDDWIAIKRFCEKGDYHGAQWKLNTVEDELRYDAKIIDEKDNTTYLKELDELNEKIETTKSMRKIPLSIFYKLIRQKIWLLKEIQQESGKGSKYKDPDDYEEMD